MDSDLDEKTYGAITALIKDQSFSGGTAIATAGEPTEAALYIVRKGKIEATNADGSTTLLGPGSYAGIVSLTADVESGKNGKGDSTTVTAQETLTVVNDCVCGVLTLRSLRTVINTKYLGQGKKELITSVSETTDLKLEDLQRHTLLGAGTFGQVWLVTSKIEANSTQKHPYALKIQSKYELIQDGQVSVNCGTLDLIWDFRDIEVRLQQKTHRRVAFRQ